jgi:hypothetical protein
VSTAGVGLPASGHQYWPTQAATILIALIIVPVQVAALARLVMGCPLAVKIKSNQIRLFVSRLKVKTFYCTYFITRTDMHYIRFASHLWLCLCIFWRDKGPSRIGPFGPVYHLGPRFS